MITACGPSCDVCDKYILTDASINPFSVKGIKGELHCHDKCVEIVKRAFAAQDIGLLPDGRLKRAFIEVGYQPRPVG